MKILFVLSISLDRQGPSVHLLEAMMEALVNKGHTVHVLQKDTRGPLPLIPESLPLDKVTCETIPSAFEPKGSFVKRYLIDVRYALALKSLYKKHKDCDAVFLQSSNVAGIKMFFIKRILKKKVLFNVQDIFPNNAACINAISRKSLAYRVLNIPQKYAYKHADTIITISDDMKKTLEKEGAAPEKVKVVYNWSYSDNPYYIKDEDNIFLRDAGISDTRFKVVYAGKIGALQSVQTVADAAKILRDVSDIHFYIIGDGISKNSLVTNVENSGGEENITFMDIQPPKYAPHIYSMANVNIIPLAPNIITTALPSKTATVLSCGRPIIACVGKDSEFGKKLAGYKGCFVTDSGDANALAEAVLQIKNSDKECESRMFFTECFQKSVNAATYADELISLCK